MITHIDPAELAARLKSPNPPHLLDVRQEDEHQFAALPGSRLVPLDRLADHLDDLADWQGAEVVVYCHHGIRSQHAIALLQRAGFSGLTNLRGGIDRWSVEVDPATPRY